MASHWRWSGRLRWRNFARLIIAFAFGSISHAIAASAVGHGWWGVRIAVALMILMVLGFERDPPSDPEVVCEDDERERTRP